MDSFKEFLQNESNSENTRSSYLGTVKQFHAWYEQTFGMEFTKLYRENILEFFSYLRNIKQLSAATINTKIAALSKYNEYLSVRTGQDQVIFKKDYLPVQAPYANPCTVTEAEVDAFRQRILMNETKRDYALVTLLAYGGLRISESLNLKLSNIHFESKELVVIGKGDKQRTVYMNDKIIHALRSYLKVRNNESPYLFVSRQSDQLSRNRVNKLFNKYSDKITPHTLRHFFCTMALEKGGYNYHELANQAGHANIYTTLRYTNPTAEKMQIKANKL